MIGTNVTPAYNVMTDIRVTPGYDFMTDIRMKLRYNMITEGDTNLQHDDICKVGTTHNEWTNSSIPYIRNTLVDIPMPPF